MDECMPVDFRHLLTGHEVHSAQWAGLKGKKNGELLRLLELAGYDVLLTVDQGLEYQQSLRGMRLAILVMRAPTNDIDDLAPLVGQVLSALATIQPGEVVAIE
jgi:hypothetical protein